MMTTTLCKWTSVKEGPLNIYDFATCSDNVRLVLEDVVPVTVTPETVSSSNIRITRPCNVHPLTSHFYIGKLGFNGYTFFLIFPLKHTLWVLFRTASLRRFLRVPTIYGMSKNKKNIENFI